MKKRIIVILLLLFLQSCKMSDRAVVCPCIVFRIEYDTSNSKIYYMTIKDKEGNWIKIFTTQLHVLGDTIK